MAREKSVHTGHRERLKKRLAREQTLEGFEPHEILEMLLYYSIPQGDTNPLAHRLIDHFGSLPAVLQASPEELMQIDGVGAHTASLLTFMGPLMTAVRRMAQPQIRMITGSENREVLETGAAYLKFDTIFYMVAACVTLFRNVLQGLGNHITPIVSSFVELVSKVVFAKLMVPRFGYWGVILAEPVVWILMVIPLVVMLLKSPYLKSTKKFNIA